MKMTNFTREVIDVIGVLVVDIIVGSKTFNLAFFMVDAKLIYFVLLRSD